MTTLVVLILILILYLLLLIYYIDVDNIVDNKYNLKILLMTLLHACVNDVYNLIYD